MRALYATPPKEFVKARAETVVQLQREDRDEEAKAAKKLRRPTSAAFLVNSVAQACPADVKAVLETADAVEKAQRASDAAKVRELSGELRAQADALTDRAEKFAKDAGIKFTVELRGKVETTFKSANTDEARRSVANGTLERELHASGFGAIFDAGPLPARRAKRETRVSARESRTSKKRASELKAAERAEAHAEKQVREVEERQEKIAKQARELEAEAKNAEAELVHARKMLDDAREKAQRLRE